MSRLARWVLWRCDRPYDVSAPDFGRRLAEWRRARPRWRS